MDLKDVYRVSLPRKGKKRIGRGESSGLGKTAGRGHKGAKSRSGFGGRIWYEGGQMPLFRRLPKRGFHNKWKVSYVVVNVGTLEKYFAAGDEVSPEVLRQRGIVKSRKAFIKILSRGELTKSLKVQAHGVSQAAEQKILQAGGSVERLLLPKEKTRQKLKKVKQGKEGK
ncbi:MAG: 50S ribosomal protein L15 [Planctomycetota bacterium]|nr:MAG: 50S ribosomal protein L15 [Planctomycetota bacterium]